MNKDYQCRDCGKPSECLVYKELEGVIEIGYALCDDHTNKEMASWDKMIRDLYCVICKDPALTYNYTTNEYTDRVVVPLCNEHATARTDRDVI